MRGLNHCRILMPLVLLGLLTACSGHDAEALVDRVVTQEERSTFVGQGTLVLTREDGATETLNLRIYKAFAGDAVLSVLIQEDPVRQRSIRVLSHDYIYPFKEDEQWVYLSDLGQTLHLAGRDRGVSFMETGFTYDDLKRFGQLSHEDWHYTKVEDALLEGEAVRRVLAVPANQALERVSDLRQAALYIDPQRAVIRRIDYWDRLGRHVRTVRADDIRDMNDRWAAHSVQVDNRRTRSTATVAFSQIQVDRRLDHRIFDPEQLHRLPQLLQQLEDHHDD